MAIIKAPPKQPKSVTVQARVEESVKTQLDQYAKFIDSTPSYVITEALKVLFKRDDEFKAWLGQQPSNGKIQELTGGRLKSRHPVQASRTTRSLPYRWKRPQEENGETVPKLFPLLQRLTLQKS